MLMGDVCRLCLSKQNLVWVFDKRFESGDNMKEVVYITTGVEISTKDIVSQRICEKCCQITIRMFEFRRISLRNDIYLKRECKQHQKINNTNISDTRITIKKEDTAIEKLQMKREHQQEQNPESDNIGKVHPSVHRLYKIYPQLKLPTICLKTHLAPVVSLPMDGVENYFTSRNLDFNVYTRLALNSYNKLAREKTLTKPKSPGVNTHNGEKINGNIPSIDVEINRDNATNKISIKFTNKNNDETKLHDSNMSNNEKIHDRTKINDDMESGNMEKIDCSAKRKLTEEDEPHKEAKKKSTFIESVGLIPKVSTSSESPAYVANISVPLHICDICNSVQYSAKDLKKHQNKHLRCQFCKTKFRTLENKKEHVDDLCIIKKAMKGISKVEIEKIEHNHRIRMKYPNAFIGFPPLNTEMASICDRISENSSAPTVEEPRKCTRNPIEIIEINSDDEDMSLPSTNNNREFEFDNSLLKNALLTANASQNQQNQVTVDNSNTIELPNSNAEPPISTPTVLPQQKNIVYNTVSIVKPDIKITENCILYDFDPKMCDMKLLKQLLLNHSKPQLSTDGCAQTDMPTNSSISLLNPADATTELKNLKQQLYVYIIPVVIKNGPFNVSYSYGQTEEQPTKRLCLWNDLTPIDVTDNINVLAPTDANEPVISECEKQGSENKNTQPNNSHCQMSVVNTFNSDICRLPVNAAVSPLTHNSISDTPVLLSTATYNTTGSLNIPVQVTTAPSHIPVNNVSAINLYSDSHILPNSSATNVDTSRTVQSCIPINHISSTDVFSNVYGLPSFNVTNTDNLRNGLVQTKSSINPLASISTPASVQNNPITVGTIRVKNVWELK